MEEPTEVKVTEVHYDSPEVTDSLKRKHQSREKVILGLDRIPLGGSSFIMPKDEKEMHNIRNRILHKNKRQKEKTGKDKYQVYVDYRNPNNDWKQCDSHHPAAIRGLTVERTRYKL